MPDQYDPKVSPRPSADRRQADARRGATMADDPLAELAKIVQGRPTSSAAQPSRQAPAAPPSNGAGSDLEAELLNDLQASFAAVRDVFPPAPPPVAAAAPRQAPSPTPPPPRAPIVIDEAPAPAPVAAAPAPQPAPPPHPAPRTDAGSELRDEFRLEPVDQTRLVPIPAPPVIQPMIQSSAPPPRPAAERPPAERKPEPAPEKVAEAPVERAPAKPRQPAPPPTPNLGAFQLRGSAAPPASSPPAAAAVPPRQPHSRWEQPEPARAQPAAASRFAPPRTAAPPMEDEADLDPFAEGGLFADQLEPPEIEDEFPLEDLGTLPGYADDEQLPPLEDDLEALPQRRGVSRNLLVVLGVVLVALVGGVGFAMFNGGGTVTSGAPVVIAANGDPTKITPDDTAAANDPDGQNKLIYDRVNSGDQTNTDTTLLTPDNGPIKDVGSNNGNNAISRVIIPGGPGIDAPGTGDAAPSAQANAPAATAPSATQPDAIGQVAENNIAAPVDPDAIQPIGPRKVRTVIVKPDGTIVSSAATDAAAGPSDATAPAASATAAKPAATDAAPAPAVIDDTAAITGNTGDALPITAPAADGTTAPPDATPVAVAAAPAAETAPAAATKPTAAKPPSVKLAVTKPAATKPPAADLQVAAADTSNDPSPIDIVPGASATPPASSGVLVQISSQRTEDAARATYRDLQARYPNILGSYDVNVQRADVPDRGTFYRVRVGPFSQADAQRLCDDLRQAGGDCVLAKR
ncbi:MAG: SPOR domain-containing protein [Bauldia sp.]